MLRDARKNLSGRDLMWAAIRELRDGWTLADLSRKTGIKEGTIRDYVTGLERAGFVAQTGTAEVPAYREHSHYMRHVYALVRDCGVDAPRVRKDGSIVPQSGRERMWRAMRIIGDFHLVELTKYASQGGPPVSESEARGYCQALSRGGYLQRVNAHRYRFVPARYSGARPPQILRVRKLYDPNLDKIIWESTPRVEGEADA